MFLRSLLVSLGIVRSIRAASCPDVSTVTAITSTTVYVPATTFFTVSSTILTATDTITITPAITSQVTITSTSYTGTASTSYIFLPGSPPSKRDTVPAQVRAACNADNCLRALRATNILSSARDFCSAYTTAPSSPSPFPSYIPSECNASRVSSACSCLSTLTSPCTTPTTTSTNTIFLTSIATNTVTTLIFAIETTTVTVQSSEVITTSITLPPPATTTTVYPCASPANNQGPTYGDASGTSNLGLQNNIYPLSTPEGTSAQSCCNTCFFELENCVQAYWYFYQGCVVSQATDLGSATGQGVTGNCPAGTFGGLSYGPDVNPAFRSTGNIAGPCGVSYLNL